MTLLVTQWQNSINSQINRFTDSLVVCVKNIHYELELNKMIVGNSYQSLSLLEADQNRHEPPCNAIMTEIDR